MSRDYLCPDCERITRCADYEVGHCVLSDCRTITIKRLRTDLEAAQKAFKQEHKVVYSLTEALEETQKDLAAVKGEVEGLKTSNGNLKKTIGYWWPRLGYSKFNEMVYPALGDFRATEAPALAERHRLANEIAKEEDARTLTCHERDSIRGERDSAMAERDAAREKIERLKGVGNGLMRIKFTLTPEWLEDEKKEYGETGPDWWLRDFSYGVNRETGELYINGAGWSTDRDKAGVFTSDQLKHFHLFMKYLTEKNCMPHSGKLAIQYQAITLEP